MAVFCAKRRNDAIQLPEGPMTVRINSQQATSSSSRTAIVLPAVLFCAILIFAVVVTLRYAGGG